MTAPLGWPAGRAGMTRFGRLPIKGVYVRSSHRAWVSRSRPEFRGAAVFSLRDNQLEDGGLAVFWIRPCDCRPLSRCSRSGNLPVLVTLMIRVPAFPSRLNTMSMSSERKEVCARRRRRRAHADFLANCATKGDHPNIRRQGIEVQPRSLSKSCAGPRSRGRSSPPDRRRSWSR